MVCLGNKQRSFCCFLDFTQVFAISCLTTSNLPWFMDRTFQVPMQYWSLQHQILLLSTVTSTAGYCFCFGSIPSFFPELFLHWSSVAYWAPNELSQFSFQFQRKAMPKNAQTTKQLYSSHTLVKKCSKFFQARIQQYVNHELPVVQAGFRKGRGTSDQIAKIRWIMDKTREFQKNIYFCFIDYAKAFDCLDHNKLENSERDGNTRPPDLPLEKSVCRSGSNS